MPKLFIVLRRRSLLLALFVVLVGLTGCGLKGPLFLPSDAPSPATVNNGDAPSTSATGQSGTQQGNDEENQEEDHQEPQ